VAHGKLKRSTIADALGLSGGRISQLKGQGMPVDSVDAAKEWYAKNVDPTFSPTPFRNLKQRAVVAAVSEAYDLAAGRAKREHHEANIAEMRERQLAGQLVEVEAVKKLLADAGAQIRLSLERIPDKLADRLAVETSPDACHALITAEIGLVLEELAAVRVG